MFYYSKPGTLLQATTVQCIVMMSHEQTLITKEHIAMRTNLILWFNSLTTQVLWW